MSWGSAGRRRDIISARTAWWELINAHSREQTRVNPDADRQACPVRLRGSDPGPSWRAASNRLRGSTRCLSDRHVHWLALPPAAALHRHLLSTSSRHRSIPMLLTEITRSPIHPPTIATYHVHHARQAIIRTRGGAACRAALRDGLRPSLQHPCGRHGQLQISYVANCACTIASSTHHLTSFLVFRLSRAYTSAAECSWPALPLNETTSLVGTPGTSNSSSASVGKLCQLSRPIDMIALTRGTQILNSPRRIDFVPIRT